MNRPFFSVIVPVYKIRQEFLEDCVKSIINQRFRNIELILVDDGSPDDCGALCDGYAVEDERIRVIHQKNQGVSVARNTGIDAANGEWIMFADPDDWVKEDICEKLAEYLLDGDSDILMFRHLKVTGNRQELLEFDLEPGIVYDTSDILVKEKLYRLGMSPKRAGSYGFQYCWDKVFSRQFLLDHDIKFPPGVHKSQDRIFICRCLEKVRRFRFINEIGYCYRQNTDSVCYRYSEKVDEYRVRLAEILIPVAHRMDDEIGEKKGLPKGEYNVIYNDCINFLFFIITDILFLKFFHPDNPDSKRKRFHQAGCFLRSEPFKSVIRYVRYGELSNARKIKKFLLSIGAVRTFYILFKLKY